MRDRLTECNKVLFAHNHEHHPENTPQSNIKQLAPAAARGVHPAPLDPSLGYNSYSGPSPSNRELAVATPLLVDSPMHRNVRKGSIISEKEPKNGLSYVPRSHSSAQERVDDPQPYPPQETKTGVASDGELEYSPDEHFDDEEYVFCGVYILFFHFYHV